MSRVLFVLLIAIAVPSCSPTNEAKPDAGATCGNHSVELGETCDGNCPTQCNDGNACTADSLTGGTTSCDAACHFDPIAACTSGDGCCPAGCTVATDSDCSAFCGDGVIEPGETCDGASCPTVCDDHVACTADILAGAASSCSTACSFVPVTMCIGGDGCCAPGCNANNDSDCSPTCNNGVVETGEICDGNCPTSCGDGMACTIDTLVGSSGSCSAECSHQAITACASNDGCCAPGCNALADNDCPAVCGNGIVEPGETCDGNCPTACSDNNTCTADALTGSAASCNAACTHNAITQCTGGDGCCAPGCNANNDNDCSASCGNGIVEPGETCDGNCPTACGDGNTCTLDALQGTPGTCNVVCAHHPITVCGADGCCAEGCYNSNDTDCAQHTQLPTEGCGAATDCAASMFCIAEAQGFPGGFCYSNCMSDADCGAGNHCGFAGACVHDSASDGDCRTGYTCADFDGAGRNECMPTSFPH